MIWVLAIALMFAYATISRIFGMDKVIDHDKFGPSQCLFVLFLKLPFDVFVFYLIAKHMVRYF